METLLLLQTAGGECPEDIALLHGDECLERGLGYALPKVGALRGYLNRFHEEEWELARPPRTVPKSSMMPSSEGVQGVQQFQAGLVGQLAQRYEAQVQPLTVATVDEDATMIGSHKEAALAHYDGGQGYQPVVAVWADEFRDGNVPAQQSPLTCARWAFTALPSTVKERYFRGDSACHKNERLRGLNHPDRVQEPGGRMGFAVSAKLSEALAAALAKVPESAWKTFGAEADGTLRQWAEADFVPGEAKEKKARKPLRYVGLRLLKAQGVLFGDGSDRHDHAVITNQDWDGARLWQWHREKAGTIEHVQEEIKNGLGGGHMPSQPFAANAAGFKLALISYHIASAIQGLCFSPEERAARMKKYRLFIVHLAGRMSRFQCTLRLRFRASKAAIKRVFRVWEVFELPTQATAFR